MATLFLLSWPALVPAFFIMLAGALRYYKEWALVLRSIHRILLPTLIIGFCITQLYFAGSVEAFNIESGAVAGLAGLGNPVTGDADSMEWNPAALGENEYMFQFIVTPISTRLTTDDWSIENIVRLLRDEYSLTDRTQLIKELRGHDLKGTASLSGGAHLALGNNGVGVSVRGYADAKVTADAATLLLVGGEEGKEYHLAGSEGELLTIGDVRVASVYSDPWLAGLLHITGFHMGGTLRYLQGLQYAWAETSGDAVQIVKDGDTYKTIGDGSLSTWRSGTGYGMATDLGLLVRLTPGFAIDASITDLGITMWQDVEESVYKYQVDPVTGVGSFNYTGSTGTDLRPYKTLPTKLRAGLSITKSSGFLWSLRYAKQLIGELAGEDEWVLSVQLNRWEALPLRLAAKYDTVEHNLTFATGVGIHLGPLVLDVGTPNLTGLMSHGRDASISISTGLRF